MELMGGFVLLTCLHFTKYIQTPRINKKRMTADTSIAIISELPRDVDVIVLSTPLAPLDVSAPVFLAGLILGRVNGDVERVRLRDGLTLGRLEGDLEGVLLYDGLVLGNLEGM